MAGNNYSQTTRFPNGLTNAAPWQTMGNAGTPDPTWAYQIVDDFSWKNTGLWNLTGGGTPSWTIGSNANGLAVLTCSAATTDAVGLYQTGSYFNLGSKPVFFKACLSITSPNGVGEFGMSANPSTTAGNGMYFQYTGGADLQFRCKNGASDQVVTLTGFRLSTSITSPTELGFYYDGRGWVYVYVNPTTGDNTPINAANGQPRGYVAALQTNFTSTDVSLKAHYLAAGSAGGNTFFLDYLVGSAER